MNQKALPEQGFFLLDLFCGMGGFALGFSWAGFSVVGYDIHPRVPEIFSLNQIGEAIQKDLEGPESIRPEHQNPDVIIGGPPCRPWSALNRKISPSDHRDHYLLGVYFDIVRENRPGVFLLENVPSLAQDPDFRRLTSDLSESYHITWKTVKYSDYGAASARRRLIVAGVRDDLNFDADDFFRELEAYRKPALPVKAVLDPLLTRTSRKDPDHVWPNLRTIEKYADKYKTHRFGWYRLDPNEPAPSFGNIQKTYILHPYAGNGHNVPLRVLSVREAMAIMGFPDSFRFPSGMGMKIRYQMVADAVSPVFSYAAARAVRKLLEQDAQMR